MRPMIALVLLTACAGAPPTKPPPAVAPEADWTQSLALCESPFVMKAGKAEAQAATLHLLTMQDGALQETSLKDADSKVFHKVLPWRGGMLTIAGDAAHIKAWKLSNGEWTGTSLWSPTFGGVTDRVRDLEVADVDGDGVEELVVATHDQGVVAVGSEADGVWSWQELARTPNTFVHEVEVGDLDGDGKAEVYATPSLPNQSSGAIQPGKVVRYVQGETGWTEEVIADWTDAHAKEILVADLGAGPELLALREGKTGPGARLVEPVVVTRLTRGEDGAWSQDKLATLAGERQARFLVPADLDGDGVVEVVATGFKTGVWLLDRDGPKGVFKASLIDGSSRGFEQAAHVADMDGDGTVELYVVSEPPPPAKRVLHRYIWSGRGFDRKALHTLDGHGLVWCVQHLAR